MSARDDPIESASDGSTDLYDVATWEERTSLDGLSVAVHWLLTRSAKALVVLAALFVLLAILGQIGFGVVTDPAIAALTLLSAIPAFGLAAYVWYSDVSNEPLSLLVATFMLAVLTATFAAVINSVLGPSFRSIGAIGMVLFFFLVVGPVEETVKLLAVRLYAYTDPRFDAVIDGAVYGAFAGLGFATIENLLYIIQRVDTAELAVGVGIIGAGEGIAAYRALAGPGHVIYSAFAGYYLGLAKFNPEDRGPILIKGLLIAAGIHALYNSTVGVGAGLLAAVTGLPSLVTFVIYVVVFDGVFGLALLRKLWHYRTTYHEVHDEIPEEVRPEVAEFDG